MSELFQVEQLRDEDFDFFKETVYSETGIKLTRLKQALLQSRIMRRLRALKLPTYIDYKNYLIDHYDTEIVNFINAITTNKTEFLRENRHFEFMKQQALTELVQKNGTEIRIWSAGCSTGEEPYSIAITCQEYFKGKSSVPKIKILATDIDTQVLETGINGVYPEETLQVFDQQLVNRYFDYTKGDRANVYTAKQALKKLIYFRRLNLLDKTFPMKKKFSFIFCRNVIIYFDKETQIELFEKFYHQLETGGYLFIGHSENLSGVTDRFINIGHTVYKKTQ